jgi:hypothetical protein
MSKCLHLSQVSSNVDVLKGTEQNLQITHHSGSLHWLSILTKGTSKSLILNNKGQELSCPLSY